MGTFLSTLGEIVIDEAKRDEFRDMYIKVATAGGMMEVDEIKIFGKNFALLVPLKIEDDGRVVISYNYFEDIWWEPGSFYYPRGEVYNNKVGWRHFNIVSSALQLLAEFNSSTEGYASGERVFPLDLLAGWLNYILDTKYDLKKRRNPLHMYEMLKKKHRHVTMDDICDELEPYGLCYQQELIGRIFSEMPVDEAISFFLDSDTDKQNEKFMFPPALVITAAQQAIQEWQDGDASLEQRLLDIKKFLAKAKDFILSGETGWIEKNKDLPYSVCFWYVHMLGLEVFVKLFLYKTGIVDEDLSNYTATSLRMRKTEWMINNEEKEKIPWPIRTQNLLCYQNPDDMAYWWKPESDIILTDDFWVVFYGFKLRYQEIRANMANEELMDGLSLMRVLADIGATCEEIFGLPIIFGDFFYEMTCNSQSLDNQALVKLLDNYVKAYGAQYKKEKANFMGLAAVGRSQNYKMLKKLSAILANKNLRQHLLAM